MLVKAWTFAERMTNAMGLEREEVGNERRADAGAMDAHRMSAFREGTTRGGGLLFFGHSRVLSLCPHGKVRKDRQGRGVTLR